MVFVYELYFSKAGEGEKGDGQSLLQTSWDTDTMAATQTDSSLGNFCLMQLNLILAAETAALEFALSCL